jgi:hypothetical protein
MEYCKGDRIYFVVIHHVSIRFTYYRLAYYWWNNDRDFNVVSWDVIATAEAISAISYLIVNRHRAIAYFQLPLLKK